MRTVGIAVRGTFTVLLTGTLLVAVTGTSASAAERGRGGKGTTSTEHAHGAKGGANRDCGEYCSTRDGSPSRNGNGGGKATGRPCAGCVGKADDKNPPGQAPNGSDPNNGYECDGNSGIARSNPAHTGCTASAPVAEEPETGGPAAEPDVVVPVTPVAPVVAPKPAAVVPPVEVLGERVERPGAVRAGSPAVVGAQAVKGPEVLGTRLVRPAGSSPGTLPFTGDATGELLLAGLALLVTGLGATRLGTVRRQG
jgi:hypothetical protein